MKLLKCSAIFKIILSKWYIVTQYSLLFFLCHIVRLSDVKPDFVFVRSLVICFRYTFRRRASLEYFSVIRLFCYFSWRFGCLLINYILNLHSLLPTATQYSYSCLNNPNVSCHAYLSSGLTMSSIDSPCPSESARRLFC